MIKKYTNNSWEESGYEKLETVDSTGGYRMGFNGSGEPLDDYTIKGGTFQTKNLCTLLMEGIFINTTNGTETTNASYKSSQFIPVDFDNIPEYVINAQTLSGCHISGYDTQRRYCGRTDVNRPIGTIIKSDSFTYGTADGSTTVGYNITGEGYISNGTYISSKAGMITKMKYDQYGYFPCAHTGGSKSTYYGDVVLYPQSTDIRQYIAGGDTGVGENAGAFCNYLYYGPGAVGEFICTTLTLKPIKK